jgi:hypothetical protein
MICWIALRLEEDNDDSNNIIITSNIFTSGGNKLDSIVWSSATESRSLKHELYCVIIYCLIMNRNYPNKYIVYDCKYVQQEREICFRNYISLSPDSSWRPCRQSVERN